MTWVRLDEEFTSHPKVVGAGPLGIAMQVAALCYCNRYLTDGFVPRGAVATLLDVSGVATELSDDVEQVMAWRTTSWWVVNQLLDAGLWEEVEGGFRIHDFHDYQPSRAEVEAERERNRQAGRLGGLARAAKTRPSKQGAKRVAKQSAKQPASEVVSEIQARTRTPREGDKSPSRDRDEIWDALVAACGPAPETKSGRGAWNHAAKEIRDVGATPQLVERAFAAHRRKWPNIEASPSSVAKHWTSLLNGAASTATKPAVWVDDRPARDPQAADRLAALTAMASKSLENA